MMNKKKISIKLPGSKSYTNRALIAAALARGCTRLLGFADCEDTGYMVKALRALGGSIEFRKTDQEFLAVTGGIKRLLLPPGNIYVGNAGTTMRFLVTLLGLVGSKIKLSTSKRKDCHQAILTGSDRMLVRPLGDLAAALESLGIKVELAKRWGGCPPIQFPISDCQFHKLGGRTKLKGEASSQYLSSILLCAPYFDQDTEIEIVGDLTSKPYVDLTLEVMRQFGVKVVNQDYKVFKVKAGQRYYPRDYQIEPDASSASYFIAGAALTAQTVQFSGWNLTSKQGDAGFVQVVQKMQTRAQVTKKGGGLEFVGRGDLVGVDLDMNNRPDMVPTLAVLAMFAKGKTVIRNVANLRIKECDRLKALATEIKKFGIDIQEMSDGLKIKGNPLLRKRKVVARGYSKSYIKVGTYNDHRLAMAFAIAQLVIPDIIIEEPDCVRKSFPKFWEEWRKLESRI